MKSVSKGLIYPGRDRLCDVAVCVYYIEISKPSSSLDLSFVDVGGSFVSPCLKARSVVIPSREVGVDGEVSCTRSCTE